MHITFSVNDNTGNVKFLVSDYTLSFLDDSSIIKRASHVEPINYFIRSIFYVLRSLFGEHSLVGNFTRTWPCLWRVNLAPVNGPILPSVYSNRQEAIDAEIEWLENNFL